MPETETAFVPKDKCGFLQTKEGRVRRDSGFFLAYPGQNHSGEDQKYQSIQG